MPKHLVINPVVVRKPGRIEFAPIPLNQYNRPFNEEVARLGREALVNLYHDMRMIRAFENMLLEVSLNSSYNGIAYHYHGPAHLSIGQEAAAVGQAFDLDADDLIFGKPPQPR